MSLFPSFLFMAIVKERQCTRPHDHVPEEGGNGGGENRLITGAASSRETPNLA